MLAVVVAAAALAPAVIASHAITIFNNCPDSQPVWVDSANGGQNPSSAQYTGYQPGSIAPQTSQTVTIPDAWNSRICGNADGAQCGDGVTVESMCEWNMDQGGLDYYDISNIRGFSTGFKIVPSNTSPYGGCQTVDCTSANCDCTQAYGFGDQTPSCVPNYACPSGDFTITMCP